MELDTFLGASDQTGEPIHSTLGSFSRANKLVCVCIGQQNQGATQEEKNIFWRTNLCWVSNFYWNGWAPYWNMICHSLNKSTVFEPKVHLLAVAELSASKTNEFSLGPQLLTRFHGNAFTRLRDILLTNKQNPHITSSMKAA